MQYSSQRDEKEELSDNSGVGMDPRRQFRSSFVCRSETRLSQTVEITQQAAPLAAAHQITSFRSQVGRIQLFKRSNQAANKIQNDFPFLFIFAASLLCDRKIFFQFADKIPAAESAHPDRKAEIVKNHGVVFPARRMRYAWAQQHCAALPREA